MNSRNNKALKCTCDGYALQGAFPHRRGSKFCHFRKDGSRREFGDPDFNDQYYEWMKDHGQDPTKPADDIPF